MARCALGPCLTVLEMLLFVDDIRATAVLCRIGRHGQTAPCQKMRIPFTLLLVCFCAYSYAAPVNYVSSNLVMILFPRVIRHRGSSFGINRIIDPNPIYSSEAQPAVEMARTFVAAP